MKVQPVTQWRPQDFGNVKTEQQQMSTALLSHMMSLDLKLCILGQGRALGEGDK